MSVRSARYNLLSLHNPKGLTVIPEERDAWAFLDAAGITSSRQQRAVIELVRGLKHAQLWSKMKAIYPLVGGTATTHKFNLKDPRDADAAFRLTFSGGWTHSSNGADPNGTNAWANTFLPHNTMAQNSIHIAYYIREDVRAEQIDFGAIADTVGFNVSPSIYIISRWNNGATGNDFYAVVNHTNSVAGMQTANSNSQALWIVTRTASNAQKAYKNASGFVNNTQTSNTPSASNLYLGACNVLGTAAYFSARQTAFATIGDGLTDSDATNLYNIVQRYQTSLGRNV